MRAKRVRFTRTKLVTTFVLVLVLAVSAQLAFADWAGDDTSGDGIAPVYRTDLPSDDECATLGYDFGFKINLSPNGTFPLDESNGGELKGGPSDPNNSVTISNSDGQSFDWSSTLGIDAVVVKAGDGANVYTYDPEDTGDTNLHAPLNGDGPGDPGTIRDISHVTFCYDYEVDVSKDAQTTFTRTWHWDIDKSVTPEEWALFTGDSGTSQYTVSVDKTGFTDSDWAVSGTIQIDNNTPFSANITDVTDTVSGVGAVAVDCGVTFPHDLTAGSRLTCSYSSALPDGTNRTNTVTVTTSGVVGGGEDTADVTFGAPTTEVNASVNVVDTNGQSWGPVSDDAEWMYNVTFTCDGDEGTHGNIATIVETGQSDDASVTVTCYALDVSKDATTPFDRTWEWTIDKSADQTDLTLSEGQQFLVNYDVEVDATAVDDLAVSGSITVENNTPLDAELADVTDVVSGPVAATVECGVTFPYTLLAGEDLTCSYSADLPDSTSRTNTATAVLQNYSYDKDGVGTKSGTTGFDSDPVDVTFGTPDTIIDECIDVSDTNVGFLGTVCANEAPVTFTYSLSFGAHPDADVQLECGENTHKNVADFETEDTGTTGDDDWTVNATVVCDVGCTLTPGYWKTHSKYGPAPYDDTWEQIGEDTPFFLSGQSYYEVLWTTPQGGNAYYILAHAYIAAELNQLNGASIPSEVVSAFNDATALFNTYAPDQVSDLKGKNGREERAEFIALAEILDDYNNGLTGPGHCSE